MTNNIKVYEEFDKFFIDNYPRIKSFAKRILLSEHDAEDVVQDMFMKLLDLPDVWQNEDVSGRYLFTMTRNHIFNLIKRRAIENKYQAELLEKHRIVEEFGLENEIYAKELKLMAMHAIEQMPEQRRKIIKMSRYDGKSNIQISEELNLSIRTVERHIYLALSELKKILLLLVF